jgi:hypothetical protein
MLGKAPRSLLQPAPDKSMLSSSSASAVAWLVAPPAELTLQWVGRHEAKPLLPAAAKALPEEEVLLLPAAELRSLTLLAVPLPVLARLLRSTASAAAAIAVPAVVGSWSLADAPDGSGSSELPVAAVLKGLAAAAANGLDAHPPPTRTLLGRLLLLALPLLDLLLPLLPMLPSVQAAAPGCTGTALVQFSCKALSLDALAVALPMGCGR